MIGEHLLAGAVAALGASSTALAAATQQRAAHRAPHGGGLNPRLMLALLRTPSWLASTVGLAFGYSCYLFALSRAPLALVQPILISGLVLGSLFAARLAGRRLDGRLVAGSVLCCVGLASLLVLAAPSQGTYRPIPDGAAVRVAGLLAVVLLAALVVGRRRPAHGFALAAGGLFGTTAALTKLVLAELATGWSAVLGHWPLYAMAFTAPVGFVLSQRSFQLSALLAPVNALISVTDPVVAIAIGIVVLGERIATTAAALGGELLALVAVAIGVGVVSRRGSQLARTARGEGDGSAASAPATWG